MVNKKLWMGILVMVLVLGMTVVGCGDDTNNDPKDDRPMGPQWTMVTNPPFGTGNIYDIAYGDGKFIAVGFSGSPNYNRIAYSTDGANWSLVNNLPSSIYPNAIIYGNGKWVTDNAYSTDGLSWNMATNTTSISSPKIIYGNGKFVAVGGQNKIAYSADGQTWVAVSNPPFVTGSNLDYINDIAYGNGMFIAVGGNKIASSTDGINWTAVSPSLFGNNSIRCIAYGGGKFVASNDWNATAYSLDGKSWTPIIQNKLEGDYYSLNNLSFASLAFGNGKWIGLESISSSYMGNSSDGINWTPAFNPPDITFPKGAVYGNGKFVVVGSNGNGNNGRIAYSAQ